MNLLAFIFGIIGLATSARTSVTVGGHQVSVLWLIAAIITLLAAAAALALARLLIRDGLNLRPRMVPT